MVAIWAGVSYILWLVCPSEMYLFCFISLSLAIHTNHILTVYAYTLTTVNQTDCSSDGGKGIGNSCHVRKWNA